MNSGKKYFFIVIVALVSAILISTTFVSAANLDQALSTLSQNDEWSVMAYAARGQNVAQDYLRSPISGGQATDYEKRILAIAAQGQNPSTFGSQNFVAQLKTFFDGNQIGNTSLLNDDIFGLLALKSAGESGDIISKLRNYILTHQNSDGGWGFATNVGSDTNTTALAIAALSSSGSSPSNAIDYLMSKQNSSGGFGYDSNQTPDGASTSWVISGLISAGRSVPSNAKSYLESLQLPSGSFKWMDSDSSGSVLVTSYAIVALSNKGYPIKNSGSNNPPPPPPAQNPNPNPPPPAPNPPPPSQLVNNSSCVSISVPQSVKPNESFFALVTFTNTGNKPWEVGSHRLGSQDPQDNGRWGFARVQLPVSTVTSQSPVTFSFNATAPANPGTYTISWKMLQESVEWFGNTCSATIVVTNSSVPNPTPVPTPTPNPIPAPIPPASYHVTINYPDNKIYTGWVSFNTTLTSKTGMSFGPNTPNALQALVAAMDEINLLYEIKSTSFGPFVQTINGYAPNGANGWLYSVNGTAPQTGAANYKINYGDRIQWYFGDGSIISPY